MGKFKGSRYPPAGFERREWVVAMRRNDERKVCAELEGHADGMTATDVFYAMGVGVKFMSPIRIQQALDRLVEQGVVYTLQVVTHQWYRTADNGRLFCRRGRRAALYYLGPPPTPDQFPDDVPGSSIAQEPAQNAI